MRSSLSLRSTLLPLLLLSIASSFSHAAVQNRISSVSGTAQVPLAHSIPRRALGGTDLGPVSSNLKLDSLMLTFNMTDAQQAALTQLLIDLQNPSSPRYHQWLTPEQFGAQFGLSAPDLAQVSAWLTSQGFTITGTARGSNFITFSGTAGQVQQAFGTSIHNLMINGEQHISNVYRSRAPSRPRERRHQPLRPERHQAQVPRTHQGRQASRQSTPPACTPTSLHLLQGPTTLRPATSTPSTTRLLLSPAPSMDRASRSRSWARLTSTSPMSLPSAPRPVSAPSSMQPLAPLRCPQSCCTATTPAPLRVIFPRPCWTSNGPALPLPTPRYSTSTRPTSSRFVGQRDQ